MATSKESPIDLFLPPKSDVGIPYLLYYRSGSNPYPQFFIFHHHSHDMKIISERAKRHCELMNYRFVYVRPAVVDLDKEELSRAG